MITTIQGKILECLPPTSGISKKGSAWEAQQYLIAVDDNDKDLLVFQVFGAEQIASYDLTIGKRVAVTLEIECKEWNGKWMTNIGCKQCWILPQEEAKREITSDNFDYN